MTPGAPLTPLSESWIPRIIGIPRIVVGCRFEKQSNIQHQKSNILSHPSISPISWFKNSGQEATSPAFTLQTRASARGLGQRSPLSVYIHYVYRCPGGHEEKEHTALTEVTRANRRCTISKSRNRSATLGHTAVPMVKLGCNRFCVFWGELPL